MYVGLLLNKADLSSSLHSGYNKHERYQSVFSKKKELKINTAQPMHLYTFL